MTLDKRRHRLFVEGVSDAVVINKLVALRLQEDISSPRLIEPGDAGGGFDFVRDQLEAALVTQKLERFGGVVDRDGLDGKPDRWHAMRALLGANALELGEPGSGGFLAQTSWGARVGLWMMPDNVRPGDLENFVEGLVPADAPDRAWADDASRIACERGAPFKPVQARKASLHTWLAWRDPPGLPYGTAIETSQIGTVSPAADAFVLWFKRLFLDP
ncbi:MAG: hypothetical protein QM765_32295 [Myxococcales bacterium]